MPKPLDVACFWCGGFKWMLAAMALSVAALRALGGHDVLFIAESDSLLR